jgi:hypothetical protein
VWSLVVFPVLHNNPSACEPRHSLEQFCTARGLVVDVWIEAIGSGLDFERKQVLAMVDRIIAGAVGMLVLAHQDRLVRFGFPLSEHRCVRHQCDLLVLNQQSLSPAPELTHDVLAMLHDFSRRLSGLQDYRTTLKEALAHGSDQDYSPSDPLAPTAGAGGLSATGDGHAPICLQLGPGRMEPAVCRVQGGQTG